MSDDPFVTIRQIWGPIGGHLEALRLRASGVECLVLDEQSAALGFGMASARLQVRRSDAELAHRILEGTLDVPLALMDTLREPPVPLSGHVSVKGMTVTWSAEGIEARWSDAEGVEHARTLGEGAWQSVHVSQSTRVMQPSWFGRLLHVQPVVTRWAHARLVSDELEILLSAQCVFDEALEGLPELALDGASKVGFGALRDLCIAACWLGATLARF